MYIHPALSSWWSLVSPLLLHYILTVQRSCYSKLSVQSFSRLLSLVLQKSFSHSVVVQLFLNERNSVCEMSSFLTVLCPFLHYYLWSHCRRFIKLLLKFNSSFPTEIISSEQCYYVLRKDTTVQKLSQVLYMCGK